MKTNALILGLTAIVSVAGNASAQGGKGGATTKPTEVTGIVFIEAGGSGPRITWNPIEKATYQVQRSKATDPSCCNNASPAGLTTTQWDDSSLPSSGTYIYRVIATLRSGQVVGMAQYNYTALPTPSEISAGIVIVETAGQGPTVQWKPVTGASYQVFRSKTGDTCCNRISNPGLQNNSWTDAVLPSSGSYVYRVVVTMVSGGGQVSGQTTYSYTAPTFTPMPAPMPPPMPAPMPAPTPTSGRYRVTIRSIQIAKPTIDDAGDGAGDEIFAAAAVVRVDRATATKLGVNVVRSKDYGDIGNGSTWPNRIRAGSASPSGGIAAGNSVGDPGTPGAETFPVTLWEGDLADGGEAVVIFPSVWEKDTADFVWKDYSSMWINNQAPILGLPLLVSQYTSTALTPIVATPETGQLQQGPSGSIYGNYYIGATWLSGVDRMIGIAAGASYPTYSERIVVLTHEKLATLAMGVGTDLQIPLVENIPPGGTYTIILRIERIG